MQVEFAKIVRGSSLAACWLGGLVVITLPIGLMDTASAREAVIEWRRCGMGCVVLTNQLSEPSWMPDRWAKVLVEEATYQTDAYGSPRTLLKNQKHWIFAKCGDRWFGSGFRSDGSDAKTEDIYDSGVPRTSIGDGEIYDRHQKLCESLQ